MNKPLVNVLIANYNYSKYIENALLSALDQTYENYIITIVDDNSTDNSWEVICNFMKDNFSHWVKNDYDGYKEFWVDSLSKHGKITNCQKIIALQCKNNGGPSKARNIGIAHTLDYTDIYAILDADDEMYPKKLELGAAYLGQSPQIGVVYGDCDLYDEVNRTTIREYREPFSRQRLMEECIVHSGALIKKSVLLDCKDEFGFYDENMRTCEDYDLWIRISEKYAIFHIPQALTKVTIQPNNSTLTVDKSIWQQNWNRIRQKIIMRQNV